MTGHSTIIKAIISASVWETKQQKLLTECRSRGTPLSIGGDGRADSPGHSAKYGSYGIIDLDTDKIIPIELVQVIFDICIL